MFVWRIASFHYSWSVWSSFSHLITSLQPRYVPLLHQCLPLLLLLLQPLPLPTLHTRRPLSFSHLIWPIQHDHRRLGQSRQIGQAMWRGRWCQEGALAVERGQQQGRMAAAAARGRLRARCRADAAGKAQRFGG